MDNDQREWRSNFDKNFGEREFLRFEGAFFVWIILGVTLSIVFDSVVIFLIYFFAFIALALISTRWKPVYSLF